MMNGILALLQAAPVAPAPRFWERYWDKIVPSVITAILVLLFSEPIKVLFKKLWDWFEDRLAGLGWRFRKRYLAKLADRHRWLKLIGAYSTSDLHPPRLQEVYVSLRLAAARGDDGPRFGWNEIFNPKENRLAILGSPGTGKSTLLDYLILVFTGALKHPLRDNLGRPFPLLARLREMGSEGVQTLPALLEKSSPLRKVPAGYPGRWLERGGCLVLLDGLDEVLDEARHALATEEIEALVAEYPENHYVVSCRVADGTTSFPASAPSRSSRSPATTSAVSSAPGTARFYAPAR